MTGWEKWQITWRLAVVVGAFVFGAQVGVEVGIAVGLLAFGYCFMGWAKTPRWQESEEQRAARHVRERQIREELQRGERREPWR